jgi:ubiquinone/menaquinone biosynthesis C-methylase UbiE
VSCENAPSKPKGPLSQPGPWNLVAEGYEEVTREFLAKYSAHGLAKLDLKKEHRVLDVATGPGTSSLLAAPRVQAIDALDFSSEMLAIAQKNMQKFGYTNVTLHEGDGQALPFADTSYDRAISMFGLMFFPDRKRGMAEMYRVLKAGGRALLSSWAPVSLSPAMSAMFGALAAIDPSRPAPESDISSLENPDVFQRELEAVGFQSVSIEPVEQEIEFESPEAFWEAMVRGSAPLVLLRNKVGEAEFSRQTQIAHAFLNDHLKARRSLSSTAYLAFATK